MNRAPIVQTLDLGTTCGWTIGRAGTRPRVGTWRLKTDGDAKSKAMQNLCCCLRDLWSIKDERPDVLVIETPMSGAAIANSGKSNAESGDYLWCLYGAAAGLTGPYGIRVRDVACQTARKGVLGTGRPANPKRAVLDAIRMRGFEIYDHNAADSLVLWLYWTSVHNAELLIKATENVGD